MTADVTATPDAKGPGAPPAPLTGAAMYAPGPQRITFDRPAQIRAAVLAVAFTAVFWQLLDFIPPNLGSLPSKWVHEMDWSHGPLIPVFSAYLAYLKWDRIRRCALRGAWLGLIPLLGGLGLYMWALSGLLPFAYARDLAMMITLAGVITLLCGVPIWRWVWLPWLYLFFAIPIPSRMYFALTDPLRRLAAIVASTVLNVFPNLHVERVGSNLEYLYRGVTGTIGVADACSGMRSTVTLCALGVAVAFMSERPTWQRIVLVLSCVPIATFCNFIRVTVTCWLHVFVDPKYATGQYHVMLGLAVILLAFGIFSGLGWLLNHLVVDEPEPAEASAR
ncbi:MAG: exosortase/archaeosortase family protein [Planctomycetota bacterium]